MFTSRAEFRLTLRADNADLRLTERGRALGLVDDTRWAAFCGRRDAIAAARSRAAELSLAPAEAKSVGIAVTQDGQRRTLLQLLALKDVGLKTLATLWPELSDWGPDVIEQIEVEALYAGYLTRQAAEAEAFQKDEGVMLPADLDYAAVGGLSGEAREKLAAVRPRTLGQAGRIEGVTPGALTALLAHARRRSAA